ncbi:MAG: 50S ribosomal protein L21 [Bdellovibrio sp.]|nr:MAG: 50S ribosomal protein L21 [Bdellovibrio sp.]
MYAIVRTGGKQYRVQPGDIIRVEKLENALGSEFELTDVLMIGGETSPVLGQPNVQDAKVVVVVTKQTKDRKVVIFKKRRRQGYRRFKTHRQPFTELFVKAISHGSKVARTSDEAKVVDVDQVRLERIQAKVEAKKQAREQGVREKGDVPSETGETGSKARGSAGRKVAVSERARKSPAKKASSAKGKSAKKKAGAKKAVAKKKSTKKSK